MEAFAIRHLPTGRLMPARMSKHAKGGWSWWDPHEEPGKGENGGYNDQPRILFTRKSAVNAITGWANGPFKSFHHNGAGFDGEADWTETAPVEPPRPRSRDELAIVSLEISGL